MEEPRIKAQYKLVAIYYCGITVGNAERSVILAGYSPKYARGNAYKIVARKEVQDYIKYLTELREDDIQAKIATMQDVKRFWSNIMNDSRLKTKERLKASELLAKANGAFDNTWQ